MTPEESTGVVIDLLRKAPVRVTADAASGWDGIVSAANRLCVSTLIHWRLRELQAALPPRVANELHRHYLSSAAANMRLFHELSIILRAMRAADVPVIALKGACLAETVYGNIALRPMADLDLLVKPADLPRAIRVLRDLEYDSDQPFEPVTQEAGFQDMPPMLKPGGAIVELHWTLVTPLCNARIGPDELEGIWSRAVCATIAGDPAQMLSPEDLLLHLCMHASVHHRFADVSLRAFVDVTEVARCYQESLDWSGFTDRANRWGVANGVRMALMLAEEWTDLHVPTDVWGRLGGALPSDPVLEWARHKVLEGRPAELVGEFARLRSDGGATGTLSALRTAAFPPRATMARLYGLPGSSWRVLAYYPYRLWDLWSRYRGALWKLLIRDRKFVEEARREARLRQHLGWN